MLRLIVVLQTLAGDLRDGLCGDDGATAVEYGLMVALIAVIIIGAVATIGTELGEAFDNVANELTGVGGGTTP